MALTLLIVAVALWISGLALLFRKMAFYFASNLVEGRLSCFKRRESEEGKLYFPVVEFEAEDSSKHEAVGRSSYRRKEDCPADRRFLVLYLPSRPDDGLVYGHLRYWWGVYSLIALAMVVTFCWATAFN